ncbi:MAG TPA: metallopeptidase family protein [Methylomirabilota bacterium]|nr:metallopeptidase family protein [Methylomirabilota bacterium]
MDDRLPSLPDPGTEVDFDEVIDDVVDTLPAAFLERLGSVAIVVEDEASPDQLASVGAPGLFGLYQGVPRTRFGVDNVPLPSKITLFRGSLTRANRDPARLRAAIATTLLHEIAHHFGIDDARLHELWAAGEASRAGGGRGHAHG